MEASAVLDASTFRSAISRLSGVGEGKDLPAHRYAEIGFGDCAVDVIFRNPNMTALVLGIPATRSGEMVSFGVERAVLEGVASNLKGDTVQLTFNGVTLAVACGKSSYQLQIVERTAFPPRPSTAPEHAKVPLQRFVDGLSLVTVCTGGSRPYGECVSLDKGHIVATDSFRLGLVQMDAGCEAVLTKDCAKSVKTLFSGIASDLLVSQDAHSVTFSAGGVTANVFKSSVRFPNFRTILPSDQPPAQVTFKSKDLLESLLAVTSVVVGDGINQGRDVELSVSRENLSIRASGGSVSDATSYANFDSGTVSAQVAVISGKFLVEAVRAIGEDKVTLEFRGPDKPVVVRGKSGVHIINSVKNS
jgi:DNA polymerase III sliding clamp (beta) subunit (PCNA family)